MLSGDPHNTESFMVFTCGWPSFWASKLVTDSLGFSPADGFSPRQSRYEAAENIKFTLSAGQFALHLRSNDQWPRCAS